VLGDDALKASWLAEVEEVTGSSSFSHFLMNQMGNIW
jgi:hypothetical protein